MRQHVVSLCVSILLSFGGPAAIAWGIALAIVYAFNGVLCGGLFSHVAEKCMKGITPFLANRYAASTIVSISRVLFVRATGNHVAPTQILSGRSLADGCAMGRVGFRRPQPLKASAAFGMAANEIGTNDDAFCCVNAITSAKPAAHTGLCSPVIRNDGETVKLLPC